MTADVRGDGRIWDDGLIARRARPEGGPGTLPATDPWKDVVAGETGGFDTRSFTDPRPFTETRPGDLWADDRWTDGREGWEGWEEDGARARALTRTTRHEEPLRERLRALRELVGLSRTRLDGAALGEAGRVLEEAAARRRMSRVYTTVAVAGATGSGKSTLFNALAGAHLSETGVRRPTTGVPVACVWEGEWDSGADGLLERLGVPPRSRRRMQPRDPGLRGLILVDLPDHDSAVPGHREQVDRLLKLVDAVIWVADPEKYADALLHERYLRPLAGHAEVTFVVLNQVDRLPGDAVEAVMDDLRRLLDEDGMALGEHGEPGATVLALSALTGEGVDELRHSLGVLVSERRAAGLRLSADMDGAVTRLRPIYMIDTPHGPAGLTERAREDFEDRLASAVGASAAGQTAERLWLRHAEHACSTPWARLLRWYETRRGRGEAAAALTETDDAAAEAPVVARPVLAQAVRTLVEEASTGLPQPWAKSVRDAAWRGAEGLPEALEEAITGTGESAGSDEVTGGGTGNAAGAGAGAGRGTRGADRETRVPRPRWWTAAALGQALLLAVQLLGLYLLVGVVAGGPGRVGVWLPVGLLAGGALGGPLLAWCCRMAARGPARAYGLEEERRLRRLATGWGQAWVLEPVAAELLRYREVREQYVIAAGGTDHA
ncbi:MAG TPA: GTPase [Streptomyces sp.]|nr:GTPase [Streptomyces sp.]